MNLLWTAAGRAALAAAGHVGTAAVRLTHFAIGDGSGPGSEADDGRAALRNERHRAALAGTPATQGRIAVRADFAPNASYAITEAGIFGRVGDPPGASQLLLYWTGSGVASGVAAAGTDLAVAAVIEFQNAAAEVAVTVGGNIVFGATDPATEADFGSTRYATAQETGLGAARDRSVTPAGLHSAAGKVVAALLAGEAAPGDGTIYQLVGTADGGLIVNERTQDGASAVRIARNALAISALGSRLTAAESKLLAPLVPAAGNADKTYVIKRASGANGGGLSIVEAVFRRYVTPGSHRLTVPAGVTRLRFTLVGAGGGGGGGIEIATESGTLERAGTYGDNGGGGGASQVTAAGRTLAAAAGGSGGRARAVGSSRRGPEGAPPADGSLGYGSGGRGGSAPYSRGYRPEGGLAGRVSLSTVTVTPGEALSIVVGSGGSGGRRGSGTPFRSASYQGGGNGGAGAGGLVQVVNG